LIACAVLVFVYFSFFSADFLISYTRAASLAALATTSTTSTSAQPLDIALYNQKLLQLAHRSAISTAASSTRIGQAASSTKKYLWPVKTVYPEGGALLPFTRVVAYYGNFYSTGMGILGEYPPQEVLQRLTKAAQYWQIADPSTHVIPAIDYIAITAQASAGSDGKYRFRMPATQIDKAIGLANQVHGIVILDVQVGLSTLQTELPLLEPYLKQPQVHLAIDPEFSMKTGARPGTVIGTFSSSDVNYAANYLASIVQKNNLPPKILIVHRFTPEMVTGYKNIKPLPEVQIVMDMDGWGSQAKKLNTYSRVIHAEPVEFTGFKLFYKNDVKPPGTGLLTASQILKLQPQSLFIQYQ